MKCRERLGRILHAGAAASAVLCAGPGCNVVLDLEDYNAFPDNCGAASLATARFSFTNESNGHCYSLVRSEDPTERTDFPEAKSSCAQAGGSLACINDVDELELVAKSVTTEAWLGMHAQTNAVLDFSCISGEAFTPDFPAWQEGHPTNVMGGGNCTSIIDGLIRSRGCGARLEHWLCELEP